jgi:hypothetical protein
VSKILGDARVRDRIRMLDEILVQQLVITEMKDYRLNGAMMIGG